jgi:hypothetical protein
MRYSYNFPTSAFDKVLPALALDEYQQGGNLLMKIDA